MYFHGHRSGSADPILWVAGLVVGGVVVLVVLAVTHLHPSPHPDNDTAPAVYVPTAPAAPPQQIQPTQAAPLPATRSRPPAERSHRPGYAEIDFPTNTERRRRP